MEAIITHDLSKTYPGGKEAVKGMNIALSPGEVYGFLGPNGAGKTTAVKLLTGLLAPTRGESMVFGLDPAREPEKVHALSGVVTEHARMYDHLSGAENLQFYGETFGLDKGQSKQRAQELLAQVQLEGAGDKKLATYSTGMRQRLSLARALMHRPKMLFLDEPTSGLDPESALHVNGMIRSLAQKEGTTVFLCTHQLRYAQEICTRYGLISEGSMLMEGTLEGLQQKVLPGIRVQVKASKLPKGWVFRQEKDGMETDAADEQDIPRLVRAILDAGGDVYHVSAQRPTLEDIYFALAGSREERL